MVMDSVDWVMLGNEPEPRSVNGWDAEKKNVLLVMTITRTGSEAVSNPSKTPVARRINKGEIPQRPKTLGTRLE